MNLAILSASRALLLAIGACAVMATAGCSIEARRYAPEPDEREQQQARPSQVVDVRAEPGGTNCPAGGTAIAMGHDLNGNGALDDDEIEDTQYACNGQGGVSTLMTSSALDAGRTCVAGGTLLSFGRDQNGDGSLSPAEIEGREAICNGVAGQTGANGTDGQAGADGQDGADGQAGATAIVDADGLAAGIECVTGGVSVKVGVDINFDHILDDSEVETTLFFCNGATGATGAPGLNSLVFTATEPAGENCAAGGERIDVGLDLNADGVLDDDEICRTSFACNGTPAS